MNQRYCNGMVHVIKKGETLYQLSREYRVPLPAILRANPYVDVYNLQIGQEICIPMRRPMGGGMRPPFAPQPRYEQMEERECEKSEEVREEVRAEYREDYVDEQVEECIEERMEEREEEKWWTLEEPMSLGMVLRKMDMNMEEFAMKNDLDQIMLCENTKIWGDWES